ncbi:MAG: TatD family hydrolase [Alphaproteobacteria bacterium]|jgi:TatD DNase family protein|nr:TatD family hydrolase [Alphaproteobacteria bacterium]
MFVDSHCHLGFKDFGGHGIESEKILLAAKQNGVDIMLDIATDTPAFLPAIEFSRNRDSVWTAIGVHPLHIKDNPNFTKENITQYLAEPKVIGIGETGLDYYYSVDNKKIQKQFFEKHAEICSEFNLPIIVHTRNAESDTVDMLTHFVRDMGVKGVIHCFSGNVALAKKFLDIGFYISFSGVVTFKNAVDIADSAKYIPLDRILTETDAPFLAPVPFRGKTNQPAYVRHTAEFIANLRGILINDFALSVKKNFFNLFDKVKVKDFKQ